MAGFDDPAFTLRKKFSA